LHPASLLSLVAPGDVKRDYDVVSGAEV
jgi:hypothetical protein